MLVTTKAILPTFLSKSLDWLTYEIDALVKEKTSFEIKSFVRVFNPQDSFNQEFFKDEKINYPFISYQIRNLSLAVPRAGSMISRKKGMPLATVGLSNVFEKANQIDYAVNETKDRIKVGQIWPLDVTVDVSFFTNTPQQFEEFLLSWFELFPQLGGDVYFSDGVSFPVSLYPEVEDITYPVKESDDKGDYYRGEVSGTLQTFSGRVPDVAAIKSYQNISTPPLSIEVLTDKNGNAVGNVIRVSPIR